MKTAIYKDYDAFLDRADKETNGVSKQHADANANWEKENETNKRSWNLTRCSDCSGLKDQKKDPLVIPVIPKIHSTILAACEKPDALDMATWHTCETTHCRAGWVVFKYVKDGGWLTSDYTSRVKIPPSLMADVWALVDQEKIKTELAKGIEKELAERVLNHLAAEMATDVKQILGVPERREALRAIARQHLDKITKL